MHRSRILELSLTEVAGLVLVLFGLYLTSLYSFHLFHTSVELFSIVVAAGIFIVAWNTRRISSNPYILFIGVAYLFVGLLDLLHTTTYTGMGVFKRLGSDPPIQFWIAARYLESLSLLAALPLSRRNFSAVRLLAAFFTVTALTTAAIFGNVFPSCYEDGLGVTRFKTVSEYLITVILLMTMALTWKNRESFHTPVFRCMILAMLTTAAAELSFSNYVGLFGFFNKFGHYMKVLSFYYIYKATIQSSLQNPYEVLFADLRRNQEELARAKQIAENADKSKSDFIAHTSHEVRTPLNAISGLLQLLQDTPLTRQQREYVRLASASSASLILILNDILDISRVEAGKLEINEAPFSFEAAVEHVLSMFRFQAEAGGIRIVYSAQSPIPDRLVGDVERLKQVLANLVGNAVKFTERGRVEIHAKVQSLNENPGEALLRFSVTDSGPGIPANRLEAIFEPFTQLGGPLSKKKKGAGLGLAIVKRLTSAMGGDIKVESRLGMGTTFRVELPLILPKGEEAPQPSREPTIEASIEVPPLNILVAEDDSVNRLVLTRMLENAGHTVTAVEDGRDVMEALEKEPFDVLFLDIEMEEMGGIETTRIVRASSREDLRQVRIVALTGHSMEGDRERFLAEGMDDYAAKPIGKEELARVLARVVADESTGDSRE